MDQVQAQRTEIPIPSSYSSMSAGNGEQTKGSSPGGGNSIPSPTAGGTSPQNSPPTFSHTIPDSGPSLSVPSGVSPLSPSNSKGPAPGSGDTSIAPPTPVPPQPSAKPPVTSILLPSEQTPSRTPPPATLPTPANPQITTFPPPPSTSSRTTEPVSTSSHVSPSFPSPPDLAHGPSQTTTSAPTSMTSSSPEGPISSAFSSILSKIETHNPAKSSATPPGFPVPTTSTPKQNDPQSTTSAPPLTPSSQEGSIPLSSIFSPIETHNPAKSSATPPSFPVPTDSATSTSKQNDPQTTTGAPTSTSSSQEGSIPSILSSILSPTETHNPAKSSATPASFPVPTDSATSTPKQNDPQTTTNAPTSTPPSQEGSITPASSSTLSSDKPAKSSATTSSAPTDDPQNSSEKAPSPSPSSTMDSPPITHTDAAHTQTTTTLNSPAPEPTGYPGSPNTASLTTVAGGSPTTVPGAKTPESQSPSGNPANSPSPTVDTTSVTTLSGGSHSAAPSDDPKNFVSPPTSPTTNSGKTLITTTIMSIYTTSSTVSNSGVTTYITTSPVVTTTLVGKSRARSNSGAIIGGVVGGILALLVLSIAGCYLIRRRRRSRYQQQLHDRDLTAPLSPEAIETMRETHPYRPTYDFVGEQVMSESRDNIHHASSSFVSSAFAFPRPIAEHSSLQSHVRNSSGSAFYENVSVSNDGYGSSGEESEGTERDFASAQSLYTSNDWQSSESVGVGIAIGSESSMDLHSYHTAVTRLAPVSRTPVDNDEELESPGPSPSSFPAPPNSISINPFLDVDRTVGYPVFEVSRALHSGDTVSASSEAAVLAPKEQASWTAAVAAARSADAQTPKATRSLNPFRDERYVVSVSSDSSSENTKMPTQSAPLVTPLNNPVNPFSREASQEGFSDDSRSSESHETISIPYAYSDPFEFRDKGKGKAHMPVNLMVDTKHNRLSNASSGLEFPENPSQCGIAL